MAQVIYVLIVFSLFVPLAAGAQTPAAALERGLAAEMASRFDEALAIYLPALDAQPHQADLWIRVADIYARLKREEDCIGALRRAAAASPNDASIYVRLSSAHAQAQQPEAALAAIEMAVVLAPSSVDVLQRRATLAVWSGNYGKAQESYRKLLEIRPDDADALLGLARASTWAGDTDRGVAAYRRYLAAQGGKAEVWLELGRAEVWRGNFAAASDVLDEYRELFGESEEYLAERASVLARGGRPRAATPLIERLLADRPNDYGVNLSRTVALAAQLRRRDALDATETLERLRPDQSETRGARGLVRVAVASTGEPRGSVYVDSDGLEIRRIDPRVSLAVSDGTRVDAGYERADLRAREHSGLEPLAGRRNVQSELTWIGIAQRAGRFILRGQGGYAKIESKDFFAYLLSAQFASDTVHVSAARESAAFVVSPRTVALGLTRLTHRLQLEWSPSFRYQLAMQGTYDELSDGNRRWDVLVTPRRSIARTQRLNLDLGVQLRQFGTTRNLDNGYYDPSRYESYSVIVFPYWKVADNTGVAGLFAAGLQRDTSGSFAPGGNAAVEVTVGIYRDWMLKLNAAATLNDRLQSGAFRGYGGQAVLVRRF